MNDNATHENGLSNDRLFTRFLVETDEEQTTYNYNKGTLKNKKGKKGNLVIPFMAVAMISPTMRGKQDVHIDQSEIASSHFDSRDLEEGDVDMNNDRNNSAQERFDLKYFEKTFEAKIEGINQHIDDKFELLEQKIDNTQNEIEKGADRRYKRTNLIIGVISVLVPIIEHIIFKFI